MLLDDKELTAANKRFINAITMAVEFPDCIPAECRKSRKAGKTQLEHLQCILMLLKAGCALTSAQHVKLRAAVLEVSAEQPIGQRSDAEAVSQCSSRRIKECKHIP